MTVLTPPPRSANSKEKRIVLLICAGLAAVVFLVFGQTLRNGFVNFDDDIYVYANPQVAHGFTTAGVIWAFTSCQPTGNWHPLTWLSHMLDCQLYGLNPAGHHLTNVLLHATAAILLFLLLKRLTGALWPAAFVAAVFAVHPLRVESVAWVSERKDLLSGLFFLLTLFAYARFAQKKAAAGPASCTLDQGLMLLFFTLGLMAKPMLVTLPFTLLLLDCWPLQRFNGHNWRSVLRPLLLEKIPLFFLAAIASTATFLTQKSAGAIAYTPPVLRVENALVSYVSYVLKMVWPRELAVLYPYPREIPAGEAVGAGVVLLLVTLLVIRFASRFRYLLVGWFWYLGMLVPVIGLVQAGGQAMADRYSYLPQIGLYLAIAWSVKDVVVSMRLPHPLVAVAAAGVLAVLMTGSLRQISFWRNSESLWAHTLDCTSANPEAQIDMGLALASEGNLDGAIEHYQQAVAIRPDHPFGYIKLGLALVQKGRMDEAIVNYRKLIQIWPENAETHNNLANLLAARGQAGEAIELYQEAIQINPDFVEAHDNLANLLTTQGRFTEAVQQYEEAIRLNPGYARAHYALAELLVKQNKLDEAIEHYQRVVLIDPDNIGAHYDLGLLLALRARYDEAAVNFRAAIRLKPDFANAHGNLANLLVIQGRLDEAIVEYQITIKLNPNSDQAHFRLGQALEKQAKLPEAIEQYRQTLRLNPKHQDALKQLQLLGASPTNSPVNHG